MDSFGLDESTLNLILVLSARIAADCRVDFKTLNLWSKWEVSKEARRHGGLVDNDLRRMIPTIVRRQAYRLYKSDGLGGAALIFEAVVRELEEPIRFFDDLTAWTVAAISVRQPHWRQEADAYRSDARAAWDRGRFDAAGNHLVRAALLRVLATRPASALFVPIATYAFQVSSAELAAERNLTVNSIHKINSRFQVDVKQQAVIERRLLRRNDGT